MDQSFGDALSLIQASLDHMDDGIAIFDHDLRLVRWNRAFSLLYGYPDRLMKTGVSVRDLISLNAERGIYGEGDATLLTEERFRNFSERVRNSYVRVMPDGICLEAKWYPLPEGSMVLVYRDITKQRQTEDRLRRQAEIIQGIHEAICVSDQDGLITGWNHAAEDLWGYSREEAVGQHHSLMLAEGQEYTSTTEIRAEIKAHGYFESKRRFVKKNGEEFIGLLSISILTQGVGQSERLVSFVRDISDQVKAEQALQESEARLKGVHESAADAIFTIDEQGIIETTNRAAELMFGYGPGELIGKDVGILMGGGHAAQHQDYVDKYIETGRGQILGVGPRELIGVRKDGNELAMDLSVNVMHMGDRRIFVGVVRDITDRKETRKQLQQSQKMEAVGQLTGGIAHDFNNMLAVVAGNLELAIERSGEGKDVGKLLELALEGATRGADLTKRLLAFSRQQFLEPRVIDINESISEMVDILHRTIREDVEVELEFADDVWQTKIDPIQLQSAILNLAINGRDAMPDGGRLQIKTSNVHLSDMDDAFLQGLAPGEYIVTSVSDSGVGISSEDMEHIFEPFFTTKDVGKGSGLGLSMVYGFARHSGGLAVVKSELGQGTEFAIYLPRYHEEADTEPAVQEQRGLAAEELRILLVEDDQDVRALVAQYLKAMGIRVTEASDGASVRKILKNGPKFDLLLTDVVLPGGMGGPEISRLVRQEIPDVKVLYMSGYAAHSNLRGDRIEENARLIQKPFRRRDLQDAISNIFSL